MMIRLRMILLLHHYVEHIKTNSADIDITEIERILTTAEGLVQRFDEELDEEQIGRWLQYPANDNAVWESQCLLYLAVPGIVISRAFRHQRIGVKGSSMHFRLRQKCKVQQSFDYTRQIATHCFRIIKRFR